MPLLLLIIPLFEIAAFILVGQAIGLLPTIGLVILTTLAGAILLRTQGLATLARIRAEMDSGRVPGEQLVSAFMIMIAGVLLIMPGFLTDIVGLMLFVPAIRAIFWRFMSRHVILHAGPFARGDRHARGTGRTIDLDADDFQSTAPSRHEGETPWRLPPKRDVDRS